MKFADISMGHCPGAPECRGDSHGWFTFTARLADVGGFVVEYTCIDCGSVELRDTSGGIHGQRRMVSGSAWPASSTSDTAVNSGSVAHQS